MTIDAGSLGWIGTIGAPEGPHPPLTADEAAQVRVARARACRAWQEINPANLVQHGDLYVDTDTAYRVYRGDAFSPSGEIVADMTPLAFIVKDGDVVTLLAEPR